MSPRNPLGKGRYGERGRSVTLWIEGDRIVAQWRAHGARRKRSWANTAAHRAEAKAWAERFGELRRDRAQTAPLTTAELWARYAEAEFPTLRPRSQQLYTEYWRRWEVFAAAESIAEDLGPETMARFRASLEARGLAPSTIGQTLRTVKLVYAWGYRHRLLAQNDVRDYRYKIAKERRTTAPAEYRSADLTSLLVHLPLDRATTWRAHAVLLLCGTQGVRQKAVLHLRWEDIDAETKTVTWRAAFDKVGREWTQPLRQASLAVLEVARARSEGSPWVFPAGSKKSRSPVYSAQGLWAALRGAEQAAGIPHLARRAAHGLRRMLFNDVLESSGDIGTAMAAIGDTDLRVASRYLKRRDDRLAEAFKRLDIVQGAS
jgi:integrase